MAPQTLTLFQYQPFGVRTFFLVQKQLAAGAPTTTRGATWGATTTGALQPLWNRRAPAWALVAGIEVRATTAAPSVKAIFFMRLSLFKSCHEVLWFP